MLFLINILNSVLILVCFILSNYHHSIFSIISFLTFLFPVLFVINLCFFFYWALKIDLRVILPVLTMLFLFYNSVSLYKIGAEAEIKKEGFEVMSFNSRLFNHYNWIDRDSVPYQIKKFFISEMPEVLSIQEYHGDYEQLLSSYRNKHIYFSGDNVGLSIYTNNYIVNRGIIEFDGGINNAIFIDIIEKKDTIRVYNAHFESFKVDVNSLNTDLTTIKNVIDKIKYSYIAQKKQLDSLLNHVSRSPYKSILTVDLNNTEHSYIYKKIIEKFDDVFKLKGNGFGSTYEFKFLPIRIDYVFISPSIYAKSVYIFDENLSDHKPISAFLDI